MRFNRRSPLERRRWRERLVGAALILAVASLAACGGNEPQADLDKLVACLGNAARWNVESDGKVVTATRPADPAAANDRGGDGGFADLATTVAITAKSSASQAERAEAAAQYADPDEQVARYGTVVVEASGASDRDVTAFEGCLGDQGIGD